MITSPEILTCTIKSRHHFSDDIFALTLTAQTNAPFEYMAGQYAILSLIDNDEHAPRPYSIASMPGAGEITFHIKDAGHGLSHSLATAKIGTAVQIEYPMGSAVYKPSSHPIIAIGGGLGLAPLLPIIHTALNNNPDHEIHLYHGVTDSLDLYQDRELKALADKHVHFHYTGVVESLHGTADMAAAKNHDDLSSYIAYLSGAPAMVTATFKTLEDLGLPIENAISDALSDQIKDFV